MPKTYLLIGLTGHGKSTIGNCIFNQSGDEKLIKQLPFYTSDQSSGTTQTFAHAGNDKVMILDTVGFGDPKFKPEDILNQFRNGLDAANNQIDCVLFSIKKARFTEQEEKFFHFIQDLVLLGKCKNNSILIVTDCERGWIEKKEQKENERIQKVIKNCNGQYYEFRLRFDDKEDDEDYRALNLRQRIKSIKEFNEYLNGRSFSKINMSYVQTEKFQKFFFEHIAPVLEQIIRGLWTLVQVAIRIQFPFSIPNLENEIIKNPYKNNKNKILFIGLPDSGKSSLANFIFSKHFKTEFHENSPFKTNAQTHVHYGNHELVLLDLIDFGQSEFDNQLKLSCKLINNEINWIVFVMYLYDLTDKTSAGLKLQGLFNSIKKKLRNNDVSHNSMFILTSKNLAKSDVEILTQQQFETFNRQLYHFDMTLDQNMELSPNEVIYETLLSRKKSSIKICFDP